MKLETFFNKFDELADTPDAVARMRKLILDLAVQGQLVPQDPRDGSAKQELGKLNIGILELDHPRFDIPANWAWAPLEPLLLMMKNGFNGKPNKLGGHYKVTRIETIALGSIDLSRVGFADDLPAAVVEKHLIQKGDILFSHINSEAHLGKTAICTFDDPTLIHGVNLLLLRSKPQIDPQYLNIAFRELRVSGYFISIAQRAINQSSINQKNLGKTLIPVPPIAEQKRIVTKVNELMALCDRLNAQQHERETRHAALVRASLVRFAEASTPVNLNFLFHESYTISPADLRMSILTLAVQGKLVPQDPADEPATNLLAQIADEKRRLVAARIIRQQDEAAPITDEEPPFEAPFGWEWARLSSITRRIHYGYTASAKSELKDVRLLRITDIQNNFVDWPSVPGCEIAKDDVAQYQLERGDILVARTGGTVGKTYLVQDVPVVAVFASYLIRIQGGSSLFDRYLKLFLESPTYWVQLEEGARGAAQPNVNGQTLGRMVVSVPPLAEQRRIVVKVDQLMTLVDALEMQLAASRAIGEKLVTALVAELSA